MRLIELYIFRRMLRAFFLTLLVLSATVWLSQALRQFDPVANMGQTILTFVEVSILTAGVPSVQQQMLMGVQPAAAADPVKSLGRRREALAERIEVEDKTFP